MFLCGVWGHSCLTWAQMWLFNVTYNLSLPTQWQHHSTVSLWISLYLVSFVCFHFSQYKVSKVELERKRRKVWNITNPNLLTKVVRLDYHILKNTGNPAVCEHFSLI